jgi:hypothetical protein
VTGRQVSKQRRPTPYDRRQLRRAKRELEDALRFVGYMLEDDRSEADCALRAAFGWRFATNGARLLRNAQRRFYRDCGWDPNEVVA